MSLSIDLTIVIQLIVFLFLIGLLNSFLFSPVVRLLEERKRRSVGTLEEARRLEEETLKMIEEYERKVKEAKVLAQKERARIRQEGLERKSEIIDRAREESSRFLAKVRTDLHNQAETILEHFRKEGKVIVDEMVENILGRKVA